MSDADIKVRSGIKEWVPFSTGVRYARLEITQLSVQHRKSDRVLVVSRDGEDILRVELSDDAAMHLATQLAVPLADLSDNIVQEA